MEPGQDSNNFNTTPAPTPEIDVNLANPGQANNNYLNSQIPSSDTIMAPAGQPAPAPTIPPTSAPLQASIPPTMPPAAPKSQIAWDRVAMAGAGLIVVFGLGAFFLLSSKQPATQNNNNNTPPAGTPAQQATEPLTPAELSQTTSEGAVEIASGGSYNKGSLTLEFDILEATGTDVIPEVEVQPMGTAFTGTATAKGSAAEVGADAATLHGSVVVSGLADGAYHWQARATQAGNNGDWVSFGDDASAADFAIDTVAPATPTIATVDAATVTAGQTITTTSNRPTFAGKADPNSAVSLEVKPEGIKFNATADSNGNWSVTADTDIPNGSHSLVATSQDTAGNSVSATLAMGVNTSTATATSPAAAATNTTATLAPTGDATNAVTLVALIVLVLSLGTLISVKGNEQL